MRNTHEPPNSGLGGLVSEFASRVVVALLFDHFSFPSSILFSFSGWGITKSKLNLHPSSSSCFAAAYIFINFSWVCTFIKKNSLKKSQSQHLTRTLVRTCLHTLQSTAAAWKLPRNRMTLDISWFPDWNLCWENYKRHSIYGWKFFVFTSNRGGGKCHAWKGFLRMRTDSLEKVQGRLVSLFAWKVCEKTTFIVE